MLPSARNQLIEPFYLKMMRTNALEHGSGLLPAIAEQGAELDAVDVIELLRDPWRSTVMGAWFALTHDDPRVNAAVLQALESSYGSLTSPPLAVAAVVLSGRDALPALVQYAAADDANEWGAGGFIAAAAEHVGGSVACDPSDLDRQHFDALHQLAQRLRELR